MTCRTTHHGGCECHELRHAEEEIERLARERDEAIGVAEQRESEQRTRAKDAERERDHARHERNVLAARVEAYSAEAARLRGEVQRLATERARADHLAALLEAQGKELERMRIELANVTADRDKEHAMRRDYERCITFETSCLNCARMLSTCRTAEERAERAEAIADGRLTPPDEATFSEHRRRHTIGWWLICSDPIIRVEFDAKLLSEFAERCRKHNLQWRWTPLRDDGRPTETPLAKSMPTEDPLDDVQSIRLPDRERMYAAVIEHARQLSLGEEPDDFEIMRKIDSEKKP